MLHAVLHIGDAVLIDGVLYEQATGGFLISTWFWPGEFFHLILPGSLEELGLVAILRCCWNCSLGWSCLLPEWASVVLGSAWVPNKCKMIKESNSEGVL